MFSLSQLVKPGFSSICINTLTPYWGLEIVHAKNWSAKTFWSGLYHHNESYVDDGLLPAAKCVHQNPYSEMMPVSVWRIFMTSCFPTFFWSQREASDLFITSLAFLRRTCCLCIFNSQKTNISHQTGKGTSSSSSKVPGTVGDMSYGSSQGGILPSYIMLYIGIFSYNHEIRIPMNKPRFNGMSVPRVVLLMDEILHHLGCIKPCK